MFTWAYNQLSKTWENTLTDTDGQYAELMAGSYTDNQPNFAWLEPYETKEFSQYWVSHSEDRHAGLRKPEMRPVASAGACLDSGHGNLRQHPCGNHLRR